ncbi:MAG: FecCD family ABC transporter permease [Phycisphaerales bacterium]
MRVRPINMLGLALLTFVLACTLRLLAHKGGIGFDDALRFAELRAMRIATAAAVGWSLGVCGVLLQALLRNPLASPDLLGLSPAASLAVAISALVSGHGVFTSLGEGAIAWTILPAVAGVLLAMGLLFLLSHRHGVIDPLSMILTGVVLGVLSGAGIMLAQHLAPAANLPLSRLLVGGISDDTPGPVIAAALILTLALTGWAMKFSPALDASSLSDDEALGIGLPVARLRRTLFLIVGVLTAVAVVLAGPIGFVGLVAPHVVRLLGGPGHRVLVPAAGLLGAALVIVADALSTIIDLGSGRLPIGVITALAGGPVLVALLRTRARLAD